MATVGLVLGLFVSTLLSCLLLSVMIVRLIQE